MWILTNKKKLSIEDEDEITKDGLKLVCRGTPPDVVCIWEEVM